MPYTYDYPRAALTVDCVILGLAPTGTNVLLIRRARDPFQGSWALPGGFVEIHETLLEGAHRELVIVRLRAHRRQQPQALDRQAMRIFRIEPAQERQRKGIECPDHEASSGTSWEPSARVRKSRIEVTAPSSRSP